jgi:hypothetical protein
VEQLLRYCAAHNEKLVLVGERYVWPQVWRLSGDCCLVSLRLKCSPRLNCICCLAALPCSLDYLAEIEQLLERLQLRVAGASLRMRQPYFTAVYAVISLCRHPACPAPVDVCVCLPADDCCRRQQAEELQD